ncbi:MAG: SPOR domain-containing protein [Pseudomonadota bacterium]
MGLKSFFQRKDKDAAAPARSRRNASAGDAVEAVQQARVKARQRLIGAVVLLGVGIIGFPLLFETQPRPIPVDLPIEIPRKEGAPPLQLPAPRAPAAAPRPVDGAVARDSAPVIVETPADAGREVATPASAPAVAAAPSPASAARPVAKAASKPGAPKPAAAEPQLAVRPAPAADDGQRAKALLEGKPTAAQSSRYIVQVGAFAESQAARDTRQKVEKLGLKSYTQVVETDAGKRIRVRVGPFASRDEADKAAAKLKAAGLASAVLTL